MEDLTRLHTLMQTRYGYTMTLARPPHYVDKMTGGFTSYDVYDHMGYQYMARRLTRGLAPVHGSRPGGGAAGGDPRHGRADAQGAGKRPGLFLRPDHFPEGRLQHGQAHAGGLRLGEQLALLQEYGYQVVPVGELLAESPFADVGRDEPLFDRLTALAEQRAIVFSDNRLRLDDPRVPRR